MAFIATSCLSWQARFRSANALDTSESRCRRQQHGRPFGGRLAILCCSQAPADASVAKVQYGGIQHVGMLVEDTATAKRFYMDVLGMTDDDALRNPNLPFVGAFLRAGNSQVHLMELPSVDPKVGRPDHGGR